MYNRLYETFSLACERLERSITCVVQFCLKSTKLYASMTKCFICPIMSIYRQTNHQFPQVCRTILWTGS